jgi:hypothetical protein
MTPPRALASRTTEVRLADDTTAARTDEQQADRRQRG